MIFRGLLRTTSVNGATGVVSGYDKKRARYFVDLDGSLTEVNARPENLKRLSPKAGIVQDVTLPRGILEPEVHQRVSAVVLPMDCASMETPDDVPAALAHFPFAKPYKGRVASGVDARGAARASDDTCSRPGSVLVFSPSDDEDSVMDQPQGGKGCPSVAFLMCQWFRGEPGRTLDCLGESRDGTACRIEWFKQSLADLRSALPHGADSVAFQYHNGRPMKKEEWKPYRGAIEEFARQNRGLHVYIIQASSDALDGLDTAAGARLRKVHKATDKARTMAQKEQDPFERLLANALVDEIEGVACGREQAPVFAASILYASCAAKGTKPSESFYGDADQEWMAADPQERTGPAFMASPSTTVPGGVPTLSQLSSVKVAQAAVAGVQEESVLGRSERAKLAQEVVRVVDAAEKARMAVKQGREWIDERFRAHCRRLCEEGKLPHTAAAYSAASLLTPKAYKTFVSSRSQQKSEHPATDGSESATKGTPTPTQENKPTAEFEVSSELGRHMPARLLNLKARRAADGATLPIAANIADTGAMTVILGLSDYERMERELPGSVKEVKAKKTSFGGVKGIAGTAAALFHVEFDLFKLFETASYVTSRRSR